MTKTSANQKTKTTTKKDSKMTDLSKQISKTANKGVKSKKQAMKEDVKVADWKDAAIKIMPSKSVAQLCDVVDEKELRIEAANGTTLDGITITSSDESSTYTILRSSKNHNITLRRGKAHKDSGDHIDRWKTGTPQAATIQVKKCLVDVLSWIENGEIHAIGTEVFPIEDNTVVPEKGEVVGHTKDGKMIVQFTFVEELTPQQVFVESDSESKKVKAPAKKKASEPKKVVSKKKETSVKVKKAPVIEYLNMSDYITKKGKVKAKIGNMVQMSVSGEKVQGKLVEIKKSKIILQNTAGKTRGIKTANIERSE